MTDVCSEKHRQIDKQLDTDEKRLNNLGGDAFDIVRHD